MNINQQTHVLIMASNYSGSWTLYQSVNDANKMKQVFENQYDIEDIKMYVNENYIRSNVIPAMKLLARKLKQNNQIGIIYCAGHGDWARDRNGDEMDGMDEMWKTHRHESILDDEIANIFHDIHPSSQLIVISDTCSSGTVLDLQFNNHINCIAVSSCQDPQDSLQTGDGSVMSYLLMKIIVKNPLITYKNLKIKLEAKMKKYVGDMQKCNINVSREELWDLSIFKKK